MRATIAPLLFLLLATPLLAQEEAEPVDLAVAFPSTTIVYLRVDTTDYFSSLKPEELFAGLEGEFDLPDIGSIARDRLELELSDEDVTALAQGVDGSAFGLLDIAVSGPRFQVVFAHKDLSVLARALKQAHAAEAMTVPDVEDYYDTLIYELYLPLTPTDQRDGMSFNVNPFSELLLIDQLWVSIVNNRHLVIATTENAVKDAVDYISYPDDPVDTLLGNSRYKEAVKPFIDPQAVFFLNVQALINTMERLSGDKGSSGPFQMIMEELLRTNDEQVRFFFNLLQYEQFKSFAAGFWIDESALTLRMDANLVFHNPPGWFETVRVEPRPMPFTGFIPGDAMYASVNNIEDLGAMYRRIKTFFTERATAAGRNELVEGWDALEREIQDERCSLQDVLDQLGGGFSQVVLPPVAGDRDDDPTFAMLLGVKNRRAAEEFFYSTFIESKLGRELLGTEGELTPVTVLHGVEIHQDTDNEMAFAFMDYEGESGIFLIGQLPALRRVIMARKGGTALDSMASWKPASELLYDTGSNFMYVNFGSLLQMMSGAFTGFRWDWDEEDNFDRDDTEKDDDATPYLAEFFRDTVILGSGRSTDNSYSYRLAAAGWPTRDELRGMALHFRDVERNRQVRDDFLRVRDAARTHFSVKGKPAGQISELLKSGSLRDPEWTVDPFGADDEQPRLYKLAEVPEDVDIRQAILCAYQSEPGLRGNHLAVLWNSHVVELTPQALQQAIELARQGKPLPAEGNWYRDALRPVYEMADPRKARVDRWMEDDTVDVVIIDDEGNEQEVQLEEDGLIENTEAVLDQQEADED